MRYHLLGNSGLRVSELCLGTMMPSGQPQSSLVWWDYDGECVLLSTALERQKSKNMAADAKVALLVIYRANSSRYIEVRGEVVAMGSAGAIELLRTLQIARALGGDFTLRIRPGYPSNYNEPDVAALMRASASAIAGDETVMEPEKMMGAEDFAFMTRKAPGAMFMLGAAVGDFNRPHHTPVFNIDESTLPLGVAMLADVACQLLAEKGAEKGAATN